MWNFCTRMLWSTRQTKIDTEHVGVLSPEHAMMLMEEMSLAPHVGAHKRLVMEAAIRELHSYSNGLIAYNEVHLASP
jgi:hypothetical protein